MVLSLIAIRIDKYLYNGVQECDRVEEHGPAWMIGVVEGVLSDVGVRSFQAGADALRGLVREFERHLEWFEVVIQE